MDVSDLFLNDKSDLKELGTSKKIYIDIKINIMKMKITLSLV